MKYKHKIKISSTQIEEEYNVLQCLKCDNDEIEILEYEDNFGFISTAICKKCKLKIEIKNSILHVIEKWNMENDISVLITIKNLLIFKTKNEILDLKKKQKSRLKMAHKVMVS
jgi:transcription elongation factor Elf1